MKCTPLPPLIAISVALASLSFSTQAAESPKIVVSIKPLYSLVASITEGVATPELLVKGAQSPHEFNLLPSQANTLMQADMVVYIGDSFEHFLDKPLNNLPETTEKVATGQASGLTLLPLRKQLMWGEDHDHHHEEASSGQDMHYWLSIKNAIVVTRYINIQLQKRFPEYKAQFEKNSSALIERLQVLDSTISTQLAPYKNTPFIVFHDAYQYMENAYGLHAIAAITASPEQITSPRHIAALRQMIKEHKIVCVFKEPELGTKTIEAITQSNTVKTATIDPEATTIAPSAHLYEDMMQNLAASMQQCLRHGS